MSDEDLRAILRKLVAQAKKGDKIAAREVLDRLVGKPSESVVIERLEELEQQILKLIQERHA